MRYRAKRRMRATRLRTARRLGSAVVLVVAALSFGSVAGADVGRARVALGAHQLAGASVHLSLPRPSAGVTVRPASPVAAETLADAVRGYLATRSDTKQASYAVRDLVSGRTTVVGDQPIAAASIVKLSVLEALLYQAEQEDSSLSDDERSLAAQMIEESDNDAASALWDGVGGAAGMTDYWSQLGLEDTQPDSSGHWGLTTTTARDQLAVLAAIATPSSLLDADAIDEVNTYLDGVEPDQRWGVSGGVPGDVTVQLKNGWLPFGSDTNSDWVVNSIGHVHGEGRDYLIAVLTAGSPTEDYGIATIEGLSGLTWRHAASRP